MSLAYHDPLAFPVAHLEYIATPLTMAEVQHATVSTYQGDLAGKLHEQSSAEQLLKMLHLLAAP